MPRTSAQKKKIMKLYQEARAMVMQGIPYRIIGRRLTSPEKPNGYSAEWARRVAKGRNARPPIKALEAHLDITQREPYDSGC